MAGVRGFFKGTYKCHFGHDHTNMAEVEHCAEIKKRQIEKERHTELERIKKEKKVALEEQRTRQMEAHATARKADCYQHAVHNMGFGGGNYLTGPPGNFGSSGNFPPMMGSHKVPGQMALPWQNDTRFVLDDSSDDEYFQ